MMPFFNFSICIDPPLTDLVLIGFGLFVLLKVVKL